ncbi:Lipoprotein [Prescottella defluvii]|uniref:hypothetical protein n=1 Tax=Prescottella defluvii TaxID=1323361 RepID=UPI0004F2461D|nr:hypothetical protein [Prescottella defluvii]
MRRITLVRSIVPAALAVVSLALSLGSAAGAQPNSPPPQTTLFQVPATFVSACSTVGFRCWVPNQIAAVTPSAATGEPGVVTFSAVPSATVATATLLDCIDVAISWRNLTTGAVGEAVLDALPYSDFSRRRPAPDEWCRYAPATAVTGSGTVVAVADVSRSVLPGESSLWPQVPIQAGFGAFPVP